MREAVEAAYISDSCVAVSSRVTPPLERLSPVMPCFRFKRTAGLAAMLLAQALGDGCSAVGEAVQRDRILNHVYEIPAEELWSHLRAVVAAKGYTFREEPRRMALVTDWRQEPSASGLQTTWSRVAAQVRPAGGNRWIVRAVRLTQRTRTGLDDPETHALEIALGHEGPGRHHEDQYASDFVVHGYVIPPMPSALFQEKRAGHAKRDLEVEAAVWARTEARAR